MSQALERLDLVSDVSQLISLYLLLKDASNNQLMKELQHQNAEYFERIIKDLNLIKKELGIDKSAESR